MSQQKPKAEKAYFNYDFLSSRDARPIRILCEYFEPLKRFREEKIRDTIVFYGSARTLPPEVAETNLQEARQKVVEHPRDRTAASALKRAEAAKVMSRYYEDARELSRLITEWSLNIPGPWNKFLVCSGGGPGVMEAANRGAREAGGKTVGLTISLPFEEQGNEYISDGLAFQFHYFFMRKYWFVYMARALVIFPGGFGTLDELMDLITLLQTGKIKRRLPVVMYGSEYWNEIVNFKALAKWGTIGEKDLDLIRFADTPQDAFEYLRKSLTNSAGKPLPRNHPIRED